MMILKPGVLNPPFTIRVLALKIMAKDIPTSTIYGGVRRMILTVIAYIVMVMCSPQIML